MKNERQLRNDVLFRIRRVFPRYPVRIEELGDNEPGFSVGVFAVPKNDVNRVKEFIFELDDQLCEGTNMVILPIVRNRQITHEYYPDLLSPWVNAGDTKKEKRTLPKEGVGEHKDIDTSLVHRILLEREEDGGSERPPFPKSDILLDCPANEDFAKAA